jgi:hypothetical protein
MLLTTFFNDCPMPTDAQVDELTRWFWVTSWSGYFAGANSTQIRQDLERIRRFARPGGSLGLKDERARPFPARFDMRSARVRAFILWELQEFSRRLAPDGREIDPVDVLARGATSAYRHVVTKPGLAAASSPANRVILPTAPRVSVKNALLTLPDDRREAVLASHGIPASALDQLHAGDDEGFIKTRQSHLAERERVFMSRFGFHVTDEIGEADIDTV